MADLFSLQDQVIHVCGGSRGIGRAIAAACHQAGARVVVSARRESTLQATGLPYEVCDIADAAQIERCVQSILSRFGRLDVLFNVAAINFRHAAETFPLDKLDDILAVNVRGNFLMARACGRVMLEQRRGKIVNIGSFQGYMSLAGVAAYGASKGAIAAMTRALAVEWAASNVQVNAIAPGFIQTDFNKILWEDPKIYAFAVERTPMGRWGTPADIVGAALFLASPASDYVTGQVIYVDGGLSAGSTWPLVVPR
jgi:NAD(P)-dependent dehydrogenase (short-subunit alcohol dehydrogenase family)